MSKYYMIPFANVPPKDPNHTVWYASWSEERPSKEPGAPSPCVIGVAKDGKLPPGAKFLAETNAKDPPPPPPLGVGGSPEYEEALRKWLEGIQGA